MLRVVYIAVVGVVHVAERKVLAVSRAFTEFDLGGYVLAGENLRLS